MEETPCNYPATVPGDTCKSALRHPLLWCLPGSWCLLGCQYRCKCCPADQYFLTAPLCSASPHLLGGYRGIQPLPASPLQPYRMQRWPFAVGEKVVWWEGGQRVFPAADWCCDPRESSKACEEYSWHLMQHPRLSFISPSYIYIVLHQSICVVPGTTGYGSCLTELHWCKKIFWVLRVLEHFSSSCGFLAPRLCMCWEQQHSWRNALGPNSSWRGSSNPASPSRCQSIGKKREADLCQIWASALPKFDFELWVSVTILPHQQSWSTFMSVEFVQNRTLEVIIITISTLGTWYPITASLCLSMVVLMHSTAGRAARVWGPWSSYNQFWAGLENNAFVGFYFPFANEKRSLPSPH